MRRESHDSRLESWRVRSGRSTHATSCSFVLAGLSTLAFEFSRAVPNTSAAWPIVTACVFVSLVWAARKVHGRWSNRARRQQVGGWELCLLALLLIAPLGWQFGRWLLVRRIEPLEVPLLEGLRNLGLGLVGMSAWRTADALSVLANMFVLLSSVATGSHPALLPLTGLFAVTGSCWLISVYWQQLPARCDGLVETQTRGLQSPALISALAVAGLLAAASLLPGRSVLVLAGLLASSGGEDGNHPDASSGVGDGDHEVRGEYDPKSTGFSDSDIFLETDQPTLYDVFNDFYGEPIKRETIERVVAIDPGNMREQQSRPPENLKASREFTLTRRPRPRDRRLADLAGDALVYLQGPTPLHVALTTFDTFDGETWNEEAHTSQALRLTRLDRSKFWWAIDRVALRIFAGTVSHRLKVSGLRGDVLPAPPHVSQFRVGQIDRADFFAWAQAELLRMAGRTVPGGTVVESVSQTIDPEVVATLDIPQPQAASRSRYLQTPELPAAAVELLDSWGAGRTRGWEQVEAVLNHLRAHAELDFTFDPEPASAGNSADSLSRFLLDTRRGPDYQFATAAAIALRRLGYETRLVGGLYAGPEHHDASTGHTPLTLENVHVWVQLLLPGGTWVTIEPSPGYAVLGPARSLGEQLVRALGAAWIWGRERWPWVLGTCVLWVVCWRFRVRVADACLTLWWMVGGGSCIRRRAMLTLALIESRARLAGVRRPQGCTPRKWFEPLGSGDGECLGAVLRMVEWARFAPQGGSARNPWDETYARRVCWDAARSWTLSRLRRSNDLIETLKGATT